MVATLAGCNGGTPRDQVIDPAGTGRTITIRDRSGAIVVHLPMSYEAGSTRYPVVYLVHGSNADGTQWLDVGAATQADRLAASGAIAPVILVMPNEGDRSSAQEAEDVVARIVPLIDGRFRTIADAAHRALGGISRGGGAALRVGATHPDIIGVIAGHSPTIPGDPTDLARALRPVGGRLWLDVGDSDGLRDPVTKLADALKADGTSVEFREFAGRHDRVYWRRHMAEYLEFYASRWRSP